MTVRQLGARLDAATAAMLKHAPADVDALAGGDLATDAGTGGQFFTTFDAVNHEVRWFAEHAIPMLIRTCSDHRFSLEQIRWLGDRVIGSRMAFVSWLGMNDLATLTSEVKEALPGIATREELKTLLIALERFTHRTQFWTTFLFPWGVGAVFPHRNSASWIELMDKVLRDPDRRPPEYDDEPFESTIARLDAATKRAEMEEPADHRRLRECESRNGAGSYGQAFSTFDYVSQEMRWISEQALPLVVLACEDPLLPLANVNAFAQPFLSPPLPFLHWMGLEEYPELAWRTLKAANRAEEKEDLRTLFIGLTRYAHRLQGWLAFYFPHGAGALFPRRSAQGGAHA
jgi:hypothetical protein